MIGHIEHGSDFGGLFRYLLNQDKKARIIGGLAAGRNASELTQEFNNCADSRRTTTKPVKHFIVSFSPEDGFVADEVKVRIAEKVVKELGYDKNQYLVVDHHRDDPGHNWNHDHDHIHIVANMITIDGQRVDDWQDKRRFEKILRRLEREESLAVVEPSQDRKLKAPSHGQVQRLKREIKEYQLGERTEEPEIPQIIRLQAAIDAVCADKPDLTTMVGRLWHLGIDARPTISDKGRKRISYALGDLKVRGSKLHNASFPKLIKERGLDFDLDRDRAFMEAAAQGYELPIAPSKLIDWQEINLADYLPSAIKSQLPSVQESILKEVTEPELELLAKEKELQVTPEPIPQFNKYLVPSMPIDLSHPEDWISLKPQPKPKPRPVARTQLKTSVPKSNKPTPFNEQIFLDLILTKNREQAKAMVRLLYGGQFKITVESEVVSVFDKGLSHALAFEARQKSGKWEINSRMDKRILKDMIENFSRLVDRDRSKRTVQRQQNNKYWDMER